MFSSGLVFAEENGAFSSRTSTTAEGGFNLGYGNDQMADHAIDQRIIDRLGLFDPSDSGQSTRYSVENAPFSSAKTNPDENMPSMKIKIRSFK